MIRVFSAFLITIFLMLTQNSCRSSKKDEGTSSVGTRASWLPSDWDGTTDYDKGERRVK